MPHLRSLIAISLLTLVSFDTAEGEAAGVWSPAVQMQFKTIEQTALSADASMVAFTVREAIDVGPAPRFLRRVWLTATDGTGARPLTSAQHSSAAPGFSADGRLAFLSSRSGRSQVWVMGLSDTAPRRVTDAPRGVTRFAWSPVDSRLAYTAPDPRSPPMSSATPTRPGMRVAEAERVNDHLYVLDVDDERLAFPEAFQVTWGAYHVLDVRWSPAGEQIAAAIAPRAGADAAMRASDLITVLLAGRGVHRQARLTGMSGTETGPRWSPDGRWVAFSGSGDRPEPIGRGDLHVVGSTGGEPRALAPTAERSGRGPLGWTADGRAVVIAENSGTSVHVFAVPLDGSPPARLTSDPGHRDAFSGTAAGHAAYSLEAPDRPAEVFLLDLASGRERRLSSVNRDVEMPPLGRTEVVRWRSTDGTRVEGLLTRPAIDSGSSAPLAIILHGGPAGAFTATFTGGPDAIMVESLVQAGFVVLRPNPRGSLGYGPEFRYGSVQDWGGSDAADVLAGIDHLADRGVADRDRVVVTGRGYGGYLALRVAMRSDRVRAVSVEAPLVDLTTLALTTDIPAFLGAYMGGDLPEAADSYARMGLLHHLGEIKAPVQVILGDADRRIPRMQGIALHEGLRRRGVATELILVDGASVSDRPDLLASAQLALHAWLRRSLEPPAPEAPVRRPPAQPRRTRFVPAEYEPYGDAGDGIIEGDAYVVLPDGSRRTCADKLVFMNPVTTLSTEWYLRNVVDREELEPIPPTGPTRNYHWITRADQDGRFRFVDLPAGEYYLGCRALETEGFAHGRVTVAAGAPAFTRLRRHVVASPPSPIDDDAPPGSAGRRAVGSRDSGTQDPGGAKAEHWVQLAGTWSCTARTPDGSSGIRETRSLWTWEPILDGRGVRDDYLGINDDGSARFRGTAIRIFNPETGEWEVTWADSMSAGSRTYRATSTADSIDMRNDDPNFRTFFYDITPTSFEWLTEPSGGRMRCVRDTAVRR